MVGESVGGPRVLQMDGPISVALPLGQEPWRISGAYARPPLDWRKRSELYSLFVRGFVDLVRSGGMWACHMGERLGGRTNRW